MNYPYEALRRGGYEGLLFLAFGAGLAVFAIACGALFLVFYLFWRSSRPAAVFAVSLGLYTWTLLISFYIVLNAAMLFRDLQGSRNPISDVGASPLAKNDAPFTITVTPQGVLRRPPNANPFSAPIADVPVRVWSIAVFGAIVFISVGMLRRPSYPPPSSKFESGAQPRLRKILEDTAGRCGVRLPESIYWIPKPNAQAMMVGGWLGLGAKPAIAIGLPLVRVLTVDELRAALAHEFHHLRRGDSFLFGCVFNARRTAEAIAESFQTHPRIFSGFFFTVYSSFLWRLSMPIVRNWEYEADRFAARTISAGSLARALVKLDFAQSRFEAFRRNWLDPVLESGYAPPVISGFWEHYEHCALQERNYGRLIAAREANRQSDTHPPLRERLLQLAQFEYSTPSVSDAPAFLLIDEPDQVEAALYPPKTGARSEAAWNTEVLQKLMAVWEKEVLAATRRRQGGVEVNSLPKLCSSLPYTATYLGYDKKETDAIERILMKAFAVALNNTGWTPILERGSLLFHRGSFSLDTAAEIRRLKMRQAPSWLAECEEWDISELSLLPEVEPALQSSRRGRFCSRCLRSFPNPLERCPVCLKPL